MMIKVPMPRLSEAMINGKLLAWNIGVGDYVSKGDLIAEIEADKANMEIEAPTDGRIVSLLANPGETVPVDQCLVELDDSDVSGVSTAASPSAATLAPASDRSPLEDRLQKFKNQ